MPYKSVKQKFAKTQQPCMIVDPQLAITTSACLYNTHCGDEDVQKSAQFAGGGVSRGLGNFLGLQYCLSQSQTENFTQICHI